MKQIAIRNREVRVWFVMLGILSILLFARGVATKPANKYTMDLQPMSVATNSTVTKGKPIRFSEGTLPKETECLRILRDQVSNKAGKIKDDMLSGLQIGICSLVSFGYKSLTRQGYIRYEVIPSPTHSKTYLMAYIHRQDGKKNSLFY